MYQVLKIDRRAGIYYVGIHLHTYMYSIYLTTILTGCNAESAVTGSVCLSNSLLFLNCLRYQIINCTTLSQIAAVMFLSNHCLLKVAKNCQIAGHKSIFGSITSWAQLIRA